MSRTARAFEKWYTSRPDFVDGSTEFRSWIALSASGEKTCLEIGPGPDNGTSRFIASRFEVVDGLDIDPAARGNPSMRRVYLYDGTRFPLPSNAYDCVVADYVLEHVAKPIPFAREIRRALMPGGQFFFRTPNLFHYVSLFAWITPYFVHRLLSNWLRGHGGAHEVYPTYHRMNTPGRLRQIARDAGFAKWRLLMREKEPSYGRKSLLLFYPMAIYERIVNSTRVFRLFRANIFGCFMKGPGSCPGPSTGRKTEAHGNLHDGVHVQWT
jgi:SAM-dependent methyltransferase